MSDNAYSVRKRRVRIYFAVQSLHARYTSRLLERVDLDICVKDDPLELVVDIIQDLTVHFECLDNSLVRVLQGETG